VLTYRVVRDIHEQQIRDLAGATAAADEPKTSKQLTLWRRGLGRGAARVGVGARADTPWRAGGCD
jgi:hypothetical protein